MRKFPKLKYPGDPETAGVLSGEVVVTEKLDGANFRLEVDDDENVRIGTRNHHYALDDENLPKAFEHTREWVVENVVNDDYTRRLLAGAGTFFGEAMHYHSIKYADVDYVTPSSGSPYFGDAPNVVFFDAHNGNEWMEWDAFVTVAEACELPTTRVIARGDGEALKENGDLAIPNESMFGGHPEGIVVRRTDGLVRAKKVSDDFKEKNAQAFDDPSKAQGDAAEFVAAFITKPRIEKTASKLVDEGSYDHLEMPMMEDLPREVIKDAFAEIGWSDLINGPFEAEWDDDFKSGVRSRTSKKCARLLKQMLGEF